MAKSSQYDLTVVSLFAGCGGSSLGYKMAGYKELLAVEWEANAAESFKRNFAGVELWKGDICKLHGDVAVAAAGVKRGELDVLDGSPPCQGFSTIGRRKLHDSRNSLFQEYVRLLQAFKPRAFVMENVAGMVKGKMRLVFAECLKELKASGYNVLAKVLNAKYYEVPQSRQRLIIIGIREDVACFPSHPKAVGVPRSAGSALHGVNPGEVPPRLKGRYLEWWNVIPPGKAASHALQTTSYFNSCVKLDFSKPSQAIAKMQVSSGHATLTHPLEPRALSINEAKALSTFPQEFVLTGKYETQWAQIGNAVPPKFMYHIAKHVSGLLRQE